MKTAMQELIEWLNDYPTNVPTIHKSAVISKAESMLEKEKEQMVDFAFKYGDLTTRQIADSFDKEYNTNDK
jgi:ribosome-associated toxin RatA of RatAB toxin-antitoxin module